MIHVIDQRRDRLVARTLRDLNEVRQNDGHADRGNQRRQTEGSAKRPIGNTFDCPVPETRHKHRDDEHDQKRQGDRNACNECRENKKDDQGSEAAKHEDIAMGEVDHADNTIDHRIADCDKAIDRSKSQPVQELLDEVLH